MKDLEAVSPTLQYYQSTVYWLSGGGVHGSRTNTHIHTETPIQFFFS